MIFYLRPYVYEYAQNINSNTILLEEGSTTNISPGNALFRKRNENDVVFEHKAEPVGNYVLELNNEVVATGGFFSSLQYAVCRFIYGSEKRLPQERIGELSYPGVEKTMLPQWQSSCSPNRHGQYCFRSNTHKGRFKSCWLHAFRHS